MKIISQKTAGFTLIEAIVSIALLVMAITGPMALSAHSLRISRDARLQLEATHIAEEGLEIVYSVRNDNSVDDVSVTHLAWMNDILAECTPGAGIVGCVADVTAHTNPNVWTASALSRCSAAQCPDAKKLYQNSVGTYRQRNGGLGGAWTVTGFTRLITTTVVVPNRQVKVTSTVTYKGYGGQTRTVAVVADMYNWFPCLLAVCNP